MPITESLIRKKKRISISAQQWESSQIKWSDKLASVQGCTTWVHEH